MWKKNITKITKITFFNVIKVGIVLLIINFYSSIIGESCQRCYLIVNINANICLYAFVLEQRTPDKCLLA